MNKLFLLLSCLSLLPQMLHAENLITLTDADEVRIGQILAEQFEQEEGMAPTPQTRKLDQYLQTVGDRVAVHAQRKLPYQFHFDPSPGFKSAVGLPGGQIFVGAGILAYIDTEDQLAAVLGHEVEHVALNQCRDRLVKQLGELHLSAQDASRPDPAQPDSKSDLKTYKLKVDPFLPGYGHDNEFAADREGVTLAIQAGYVPDAVIRLLQTYVILGDQMPNTPKEAKANLEARIAQIRTLSAASTLPKPAAEKPLALP
jgi:beta-barrel assembly-enhancing protease